jgi:hypothetical protein
MTIKLGASFSCLFDTYSRAENTEITEVWFETVPRLKWGSHDGFVDTAVVKKCSVNKSGGPIFRREATTIEEDSHGDSKSVIPFLCALILIRTVGPRRFDIIAQ